MDNFHLRGTGKHTGSPGDDVYPGEDFDDVYLEQLRAEQYPPKNTEKKSTSSRSEKMSQLKAIGKLLTVPYRTLRAGIRGVLRRHDKHHRL